MKTKKLKLNDLKVNSFVTALNNKKALTIQGGNYSDASCPGAICYSGEACTTGNMSAGAGQICHFQTYHCSGDC